MGIWIFGRKDARNNHDFNDEDRKLAGERRKAKIELDTAILEQKKREFDRQELIREKEHDVKIARLDAELERYLPDDDDDDYIPEPTGTTETDMVLKLLEKIQPKPAVSQVSPPTISLPPASPLTDDQLRELWRTTEPKVRNLAPACTDAQVCEYLRHVMPTADDSTIQRALQIVRNS